jgi:hypothetical protein
MRPLAHWSSARVLLACIGWVVLTLLGPAVWVMIQLRLQMAETSAAGSGGIGAVSAGVSEPVVLLPPLLLVTAWLMARLRARRSR